MDLILSPESFVAFVDDTGHERLVEGHLVYGLGGCAAMGSDLEDLVRKPWKEVRRQILGSPDAPLHAASFSRAPTAEQIEVIVEFFRTQGFARFGSIITTKTRPDRDAPSLIAIIAETLKRRVCDIASQTQFRELHVIFEASERADPLIEEAFQDFRIDENGMPIPVECYFMAKSARDPALEVADFVMHAVGRQARRFVDGKDGWAPDFSAVFHSVDPKLVSFMLVTDVEVSG